MAYNRRTIWFDKQGTKHVAYLTMGDNASLFEDMQSAPDTSPAPASLSIGTLAVVGVAGVVGYHLLFGKKRSH